MKLKGLTVKTIQEYLGLGTPQGIYHWFDGRSMPTIDNLYALSELFHLPVDALLIGNRTYPCIMSWAPAFGRLFTYFRKAQGIAA